jgi:hypothetical protein
MSKRKIKRNLSKIACALDLSPIYILFVLYTVVRWLPFGIFGWLQNEDGILEWSSVTALLLASWTIGKLLRHNKHDRATLTAWIFLLIMCLVFAGEEIAWGERLHGAGIDAIRSINTQQETTLHNIASFQNRGLLNLGWSTLGLVLGFSWMLRPNFQPLPAARQCLYFLIPGIWYGIFHACNHTQNCLIIVANHQEIYEFLVAVGLLVHTRYRWRQSSKERSGTT